MKPLRVLVLTNLYPPHGVGGYEERCCQTVERLRTRGHEVLVLAGDHRKPGVETPPEEEAGRVERSLQLHGYLGRPWLPLRRLWAVERANQRALRRARQTFRPDVVHIWNLGGLSKSLCWTLARGPVPAVYDISDHWVARSLAADAWLSAWNRPRSGPAAALFSLLRALRVPDLLGAPAGAPARLPWPRAYFCSAFLRDFTARAGYAVSRARVIYCGVDAAAYARKTAWGPVRRLLWAGRLAPDKNPLVAAQGTALARLQIPDLSLDLYGAGDEAYAAEVRAVAGGADWLRFHRATHAEMRAAYARHDALLFTSGWGEPFALTPLEAMAAGLPVCLYPDGGGAELLRPGVNAEAVIQLTPEGVADAILRLAARPDHGAALAAEARAEVERRFDWAVILPQIEDALLRARAGTWET